jgi:hypothetical protein
MTGGILTDENLQPRALFGGAIELHMPPSFDDVSDSIPIPDHQEVKSWSNLPYNPSGRRIQSSYCTCFPGIRRQQGGQVVNSGNKRTPIHVVDMLSTWSIYVAPDALCHVVTTAPVACQTPHSLHAHNTPSAITLRHCSTMSPVAC